MQKYYIPRLYVSGYIQNFDQKARHYGLKKRIINKREPLTKRGVINNTTHFICSGLVHLSLTHSSGKIKPIMFFGPDTLFPIGVSPHENLIDYEMLLLAMTDLEVYSFPYTLLKTMCEEDGAFAAQILEENCKLIGSLFYQEMNQAFQPTEIRVCNTLYLLLTSLRSKDNCIPLKQNEIASFANTSSAQLERILKSLRERNIIESLRGKIKIPDISRLRAACSSELQENG